MVSRNQLAGLVIAFVVVAGAAFYAGTQYKNTSPVTTTTKPPVTGAPYSSSVVGTVVAHTKQNITLKLTDGSEKTYALSTSTTILATVSAGQQVPSLDTLQTGTLVALTLFIRADGATSVESISIAPSSLGPASTQP